MDTPPLIVFVTTMITCGLISCVSPKTDTTNSVSSPELQTDNSSVITNNSKPNSETILNEVINRQKSLQVCNFEFNPETAREFSEVYIGENHQHLVQLLCYMAAYQGAFAFVKVDTSGTEIKIQPLGLEIAGFPTYDPQTKILSNSYKYIGAGTCTQETQYYWNGEELRLISSENIDQIPNGCQDLGVLTPSESQVITNKNIGVAKLGMTLGELKEILGEGATFEPVSLGVDQGEGIKVTQDGRVQYLLGFADGDLKTANSRITMITVENPNYRTKEGVGPGTPLKAAVATYGPVTLSYNLNNEAREYIKFARGLGADAGVVIRSNQWTITEYAGMYTDTQAEFNQTQNYHDHAAIGSITIR